MMSKLKSLLEKVLYDFKQEDLIQIETEIESLFDSIKKCGSENEASFYFDTLQTIQDVVAKLVFKEGIEVSGTLREFVRHFDRLDDQRLRSLYYPLIKKGEYKFR